MSESAVAESQYNEEAPYYSTEAALQNAYRMEAQDIVKVSSYFAQLRGGTVKLRRSTDRFDLHAQAALVLSFLERHVLPAELVVVRGRYTIPNTQALERRKNCDILLMFRLVIADRPGTPNVPMRYAEDVIREWAGNRRHHNESWWANHLGVDERTLRRWRIGNSQRNSYGFVQALDDLHAEAIKKLVEPMFQAGLTRIYG